MPLTPAAVNNFDDLLGGEYSPLDRPLTLTVFNNQQAKTRAERITSIRDFAKHVHYDRGLTKADLPWLKLARFGNVATTKGSLRNNANVVTIDGVEGDYDGESISISEAAARLRAANVAALLYSSPSHTSGKPRWRVLAPLSNPTVSEERERLCARLNGALGGLLASESFTLSQSYYFGVVEGAAVPECAVVEGRALDMATELDALALGGDGLPYRRIVTPTPLPDNDGDDWEYHSLPDWDRVESALAAIPVSDADAQDTGGRDLWLRIGQALHDVSKGSADGFERWDAWSRDGVKYDARVQRSTWKSLGRRNGKRVAIGTLYHLAGQYGWRARAAAPADPIDSIGDGSLESVPTAAATALRFLAPAECESSPARGYIVKGLIAPSDLACIYGAPGAGKSLIAPHIGYLASLGHNAFGMRTKPGRVFYVAAEDPHGMRGRVTALRRRHGDAPEFVLVEGVSDLLASGSSDLAALRAAVSEQRPSMIFLDTLAMAFPGLEENTAEDMGRVVAIGRSLTKHGAAVILIHHDTKAKTPTPRGHSLLNAALDVALQLFPRDESGVVRAKLSKNRNGSTERDIAFRIATERLGVDEDGDAITAALVAELSPGDAPTPQKLTSSERAALLIYEARASSGAVTEDAWRAACIEARTVSGSEDRESRRRATRRAFEGLARKGAVLIGDGLVRRPGSVGHAFDDDDGE